MQKNNNAYQMLGSLESANGTNQVQH